MANLLVDLLNDTYRLHGGHQMSFNCIAIADTAFEAKFSVKTRHQSLNMMADIYSLHEESFPGGAIISLGFLSA